MKPPLVLQFSPQTHWLENGLGLRFDVVRWFEAHDKETWLKEHADHVRGVVTSGDFGLPKSLMDSLPNLGVVSINGVGFDKVDLECARARGIRVSTTPDVLTEDVADLAVGLVIAMLRNLPRCDRFVRNGEWLKGNMPLGKKVSSKRFGIVGLGRIGKAIAARLAPFGPVAYSGPADKFCSYQFVPNLADLAAQSDVLILACPANASTHKLVNASVLEALGPQGYLVNISRGSLVDERDLIRALTEQRAGAALDVFTDEPRVPELFLNLSNVVLTPHIGSATSETRERMANLVLENLDAFFAGSPMPSALI